MASNIQQSAPCIDAAPVRVADSSAPASPVPPENTAIDHTLLRCCDDSDQRWLQWLGEILENVSWLALLHPSAIESGQKTSLSGLWPGEAELPPMAPALAEQAAACGDPVYLTLPGTQQSQLLAIPLKARSSSGRSVLLLGINRCDQATRETLTKLCRWAANWPGKAPLSTLTHDSSPWRDLTSAIIDAVTQHRELRAVAYALVNEMALQPGCGRASLGQSAARSVSVIAVSGQSRIDQRRNGIQLLTDCMQETIERGFSGLFYGRQESSGHSAHAALYSKNSENRIWSLLLSDPAGDDYVLILEWSDDLAADAQRMQAMEQQARPAAALLNLIDKSNASPLQHARQYFRTRWLQRYRGSLNRTMISAITACVLLTIAVLMPVPHRVTARTIIEAADRQALVAAQDGYVQSAHARAGDYVEAGDVLATLDNRELTLVAEKWRGEKLKNQQEYTRALAAHDAVEISRLRADAVRVDAELKSVKQQLQRSRLIAPFSGVLLSGDLTQSLGAPVRSGEVLFEIASAERYRLLLEVDEQDVGFIVAGQSVDIRMSSLPNRLWQADLETVLPVALAEQGRTVFRVPALLAGDASALRPGMQGIGKILIGKRSLLWVYTHTLVNHLRLWAWNLGLL